MRLPSLNALRAFEAAARHGGYVAAAAELCVTRGAVSRHVKLLEEHLGMRLFVRHPQGVHLTPAGRRLQPVLAEAFGMIARETRRIAEEDAALRVLCPLATSIRWLIPRLGGFGTAHPEIRLQLTTDFHGGSGFDAEAFDLGFSVERHPGRASGIRMQPLFATRLTPACAPRLLESAGPIRVPSDLARLTLLHETPTHADWEAWLHAHPAPGVDPTSGLDFPNLDMATRAAVLGAGVVMADLMLCREELETGALVAPFRNQLCEPPTGGICLIGGRDRWDEPSVRAFREWAVKAARDEPNAVPGE